ncbi:endolytic transglycosylase MltG [Clostridium rectalis]|uniref:endolytic transglycosylase MltG n=1 Tax=Clostridium rectalis TaxID=2040295 RepID=UPI000F62E2EB|nr:endolytic transglycosylase MltG [Clostridium rectalis]
MKKRVKMLMFIIITLVCVSSLAYLYFNNVVNHPFKQKNLKIEVTVKDGDSLYKVLDSLHKDKKINNLFFIKFYIKNKNLDTNIKKGSYEFSSEVDLQQLVKSLNTGEHNKNLVKITVPEGYNVDNIATLLQEKGVISKKDFLYSLSVYDNLPYNKKNTSNKKYELEGYLYPDTYEFLKGSKGSYIIDTMVDRFNKAINEISSKYNIEKDNIDNIITIASIIEKEAENDNERGKVASVFYNRIQNEMKLESCATVLYALGKHKDKLYYNDLKVKSPYNTYLAKGLPPGPICSPGMPSIVAALKPDKTSYLFFVSYNDGTHFFTDNYNEFLKVKAATQEN